MAKEKTMSSYINSGMKPVRFSLDKKDELREEMFIKFYYGPTENPENWSPFIGKIKKINEKYLDCYADYGHCIVEYSRLFSYFIKNVTSKIKENKLNFLVAQKNTTKTYHIGILDATLERIFGILHNDNFKIDFKDDKKDTSSSYSRTITFKNNDNELILTIENENSDNISITGTNVKRQLKIKAKNGKISKSNVDKIINLIKSL